VDENGKLDDEVSVISSEVFSPSIAPSSTNNDHSKIENSTRTDSLQTRRNLQVTGGMQSEDFLSF
jgi:hypothetical protein